MRRHQLVLLIGGLLLTTSVRAEPPTPETYRVYLRYQIQAFTNDRIVQYTEMLKKLKQLGLEIDPRPEGEADQVDSTLLTGTIAAKDVRTLFQERHVRSLLIAGKDDARMADLKDKPDTQVRVQIELTTQTTIERQRELADKVRVCVGPLGFREGFAFDNQAHTRLVGMIAKSKLEILLYDLRSLPEGAKASRVPLNQQALQVVEVMPESYPEVPPLKSAPLPTAPDFEKIGPSLLALLANKEEAAKPTRMELVLVFDPVSKERPWEQALRRAVPDLIVEGRSGTLVTVMSKAESALALVQLPEVALVRLPVPATRLSIMGDPLKDDDNLEALKGSGLERLHKMKFIGQGVNIAVIDNDFRGWEELVGNRFPKSTHYVDFTAERSPSLIGEPFPAGKGLGHGTRAALIALLAAPGADLTLVRADPAAPYHLEELVRYIHGEAGQANLLNLRRLEMDKSHDELDRRRARLLEERKDILADFGQDEETKKRREAYFAKQKEFDRDEQAYVSLQRRYLDIAASYRELRKVRAVVSPYLWNEGHPVDGGSGPSRYFDDRQFRGVLWFQAAGNTRGQTWSGVFRDADGNGVMEFAPLADPTRLDKVWRLEMNRLGWRPDASQKGDNADAAAQIPAKTRVRLILQWREPHDPEFFKGGEDLYARPLARLKLVVLRQLDPDGKKQPTDDLQLVEQTVNPPYRIQNLANSAVYEQPLQFELAEAGQYVLRLEGKVPATTRPPGAPTLPALDKSWDLKPRIFIETLTEGGHVIFRDYVTDDGGIGAPGDARHVLTVGAMDAQQKPRPYSITGAPLNLDLLTKPDLLTYDAFALEGSSAELGTEYAASYAAGLAASLLSSGLAPEQLLKDVKAHPGQVLRVPDKLPERPPAPPKR